MDNYWTRLVYFNNEKTIDQDLKDAIGDVTKELETLSDKYAAAIGKYPQLTGAGEKPAAPPGGGNNQSIM